MNEMKENILNNKITLVITSHNSRTLSIINLLSEFSIQDKYKVSLFSFNIRCNYYLKKLISYLSGINTNLITKYFYPYATISKYNKDKINRDKFIDSIEKIQNSGILMSDAKYLSDTDYIDYILDYSKTDVIIVDDFSLLLDKTKYSLDEILTKVKDKKKFHLVLFLNSRNKEGILKKFEELIENYIFIEGYNDTKYKYLTIHILNKIIKMRFNKMNQPIMRKSLAMEK